MPERPDIWLVVYGEELVAELAAKRWDSPWWRGSITRRQGFEALAPLFASEPEQARETDNSKSSKAYCQLRAQVRLLKPDGEEVPEFILRVDSGRAAWRCIDPTVDLCREERGMRLEQPVSRAPVRPAAQTEATPSVVGGERSGLAATLERPSTRRAERSLAAIERLRQDLVGERRAGWPCL